MVIEKLFTSKNRIKVLGYLFFESEMLGVREISRKLGIAPSGIKREVDNLEELGIIKKMGGKIVIDKSCNYINDLKNILIKTDYINEPIRNIFEKESVEFVVLYGSFACGEYTKESDIDLLVIGDISEEKVFDLVEDLERKIKRDVNPIVWTLENLNKNKKKGFVQDIGKKNNIVLIGNKNEFERIIR